MTYPRAHLIDDNTPGYYHLISRCVRRAWLCGLDSLTGRSFEHRRGWIERRAIALSELFAVELFAYAVMSNHYHLVVRLDPQAPQAWPDETVARRWVSLVVGNADELQAALRIHSIVQDPQRLALYRQRLGSLSWFMRFMNESIARRANREDHCTGRFWEGRFTSHVLLDERSVYACMAYVDLNPIRARLADDIEAATFTSAKRRAENPDSSLSSTLTPIAGGCDDPPSSLPMSPKDYLGLLRWTAKQMTSKPGPHPPSTERPETPIDLHGWLEQVQSHRHRQRRAFGSVESLRRYAQSLGQHWLQGMGRLHRTAQYSESPL